MHVVPKSVMPATIIRVDTREWVCSPSSIHLSYGTTDSTIYCRLYLSLVRVPLSLDVLTTLHFHDKPENHGLGWAL